MNKRIFALGRLKSGQMNKTETQYAAELELLKRSGSIKDYWFEAIKLKIAEGSCFYSPDFMVLNDKDELELHEVKGSPHIFTDDAKVKVKVCATKYPFKLFVVYPRAKKLGGGWIRQEF